MRDTVTYFQDGWQHVTPVPYPGDEIYLRVICAGNPSIDRLIDLTSRHLDQIRNNILQLGDRILKELNIYDPYLTPNENHKDSDIGFPKPSCAWLLVKEALVQFAEQDKEIEKELSLPQRQWLLGEFERTGHICSYRRQQTK